MHTPLIHFRPNHLFAAVIAALGADLALAAGFQLNETSASGLGNAFAGGAAVAEDATTLWSNVAGLSRIGSMQVAGAIHLITPSIRFRNGYSASATLQAQGGDGGDAGGLNVVPNLYFALPLNPQWSVGVGLNAPWGLVTEYDNDWIGRFQAIKSEIKTINVNPGASLKVNDSLALGFGVNLQRIQATLTKQVNYSAALAGAGAAINPTLDSNLKSDVEVKGDDTGYGWNIGMLWEIAKDRRLGLQYRSSVNYVISGDVTFSNPSVRPALANDPKLQQLNSGKLFNSAVTAKLKLPPIVNLSYFGAIDSHWDMMADAQWTGWSTINDLTVVRDSGTTLDNTPLNFKDAWKLSIGANYHASDQWMLRAGLAYDMSPVRTEFRTPRLPDSDRTWLSAGAQFKWNQNLRFDFGATYIWSKKAAINKSGDPSNVLANGLLNGDYDSSVSIVSAQLTYSFR